MLLYVYLCFVFVHCSIYIYMDLCLCSCTYLCICPCTSVCVCVCARVCASVSVHTHVCLREWRECSHLPLLVAGCRALSQIVHYFPPNLIHLAATTLPAHGRPWMPPVLAVCDPYSGPGSPCSPSCWQHSAKKLSIHRAYRRSLLFVISRVHIRQCMLNSIV